MHHILYASPGPTRALSRRLRCSKHLQPFFCSLFDLLRAAGAMCFLIGATGPGVTKTGEALIGSTSDDPYLFRTFVHAALPSGDCLGHVGTELVYATDRSDLEPPFQVEPGEVGRGVNSAGLAFAIALAVERPKARTGVPEGRHEPVRFCDVSRRMMNECHTVDDALNLLQHIPAITPAFSVMLADAEGHLAQVEVGAYGTAVHERYSKENPGVAIAVNCYQSKELNGFNLPEAELHATQNNNGCRSSRGWDLVQEQMKQGKLLDVSTFRDILSDHEHRDRDPAENPLLKWWGYSICNHGTRKQDAYEADAAPWGTVSAEVLEPAKKLLHYNYGWACGEGAEFQDQLFQSHSWSHFASFRSPSAGEHTGRGGGRPVACTTVKGELLAEASQFLCTAF
ncbi:Hypothetical protein SCF082_LOCUS22710 [Durusdinium trenchii]